MAKIPFNVSAKTARLIGRENVSKLAGALIELIKNTYDADAKDCILYYEKSTNRLFIIDNGCGMSQQIILNNWMTIGCLAKSTHESERKQLMLAITGIATSRFTSRRKSRCLEISLLCT